MQSDSLQLAGGERPALVPDRVRDSEPTEIVTNPARADRDIVVGELRAVRSLRREVCDGA